MTLEIDGDLPTPGQLSEAISAFSALLNSAHRFRSFGTPVRWGVQVKSGSNLLGFVPQTPIDPQAIQNIIGGLHELETDAVLPSGFDEGMLYNMQSLCDVGRTTKKASRAVRIWLNREPIIISSAIQKNVAQILQGTFVEHGTVEGMLQVLDNHDGLEFAIFEPLHQKRIKCVAADESTFEIAYAFYNQRVSAEGMIKHSAEGIPYEIKVESIEQLAPDGALLDYRDLRGILKNYG